MGADFSDSPVGEAAEAMTMVQLADYNGPRNVMIMSPNSQTYFSDWLDSRLNTQLQGSEIGKISWTRLDSWKSGTFQKCLEQAGPRLLILPGQGAVRASARVCGPPPTWLQN